MWLVILRLTGPLYQGGGSYQLNSTAGTFNINTAPTGFSTFAISGTSQVVLGTDLDISNATLSFAGTSLNQAGHSITSGGNATFITTANFSPSGPITLIGANNNININGGTFSLSNDFSIGGATLNLNAGGALNINGHILSGTAGSIFNINTAYSPGPADTINGISTIAVNNGGTFSLSNDFSIGGGTLNLNAGGALNINGHILSGTAGSIFNINTAYSPGPADTINGISTIAVNAPGILTLISPFAIPANATLLNAGTINMNGFSITGGANSIFTTTSNFQTNGAITNVPLINVDGGTFLMNTSPTGFTTLAVNAPGTLALGTNLAIPANATLLNSGTINMNGFNITGAANSTFTSTANFQTNGAITNVPTINVDGGAFSVNNPISGYNTLTVLNAGTVNLNSGGSLTPINSVAINSAGTLNLNGGTMTGSIAGNGIVNVNGTFNTTGNISANNVNINPLGTLILNNNITGSLTNSGVLLQPAAITNTLSGNYIQSGTLVVSLGKNTNSTLQVGGTAVFNGGAIQVGLLDQGATILNNTTFTILTSNGLTLNAIPSVLSNSALLSFSPSVSGNNLILIANRTPLTTVNTVPTLQGVATNLESIRASSSASSFENILFLLDQQSSAAGVQSILESLLPEEAKGGVLETGIIGFRLPLEEIIGPGGRTDQLRAGLDRFKTGYNAGDAADSQGSYGPMFFGSSAKQGNRNGISGYNVTNLGFGFLADAPVLEYCRVGVAATYSGNSVRRSGPSRNLTIINSAQGFLYGSITYGPLFLDGTVSIGHNNYRGTRNLKQLGFSATSNYQGNQYGGKARGGFIIPVSGVEISPLGTVEYIALNRGGYTEKGAQNLSLTVNSRQASNTQIGVGVRIAETSQAEDFLPEIHALYLHDVKQASLQVTSQFVGGGGAFVSKGPLPAKSGVNVGASLSARLLDDLLVTSAYDFESKKGFKSHSASIKFRKLF